MKPLSICAIAALFLFTATQSYVSSFEGWGAWAMAPLLAVPLAFSGGVLLGGIIHFIRHRKPLALLWAVIGGLPVGWLMIRIMY